MQILEQIKEFTLAFTSNSPNVLFCLFIIIGKITFSEYPYVCNPKRVNLSGIGYNISADKFLLLSGNNESSVGSPASPGRGLALYARFP